MTLIQIMNNNNNNLARATHDAQCGSLGFCLTRTENGQMRVTEGTLPLGVKPVKTLYDATGWPPAVMSMRLLSEVFPYLLAARQVRLLPFAACRLPLAERQN